MLVPSDCISHTFTLLIDANILCLLLHSKLTSSLLSCSDTKQAVLSSRCSPKAITKLLQLIQDKDKEMKSDGLIKAIDEIGFGALKYLPSVKMEHAYIKILLDNFNVETCSIFGVQIKDKDVVNILGVPNGTETVPSISEDGNQKFKKKYGQKRLYDLKLYLKSLKSPDLDFKETFLLLAFGHMYCPFIKDEPGQEIYKALAVLQSAHRYNWGKFILDFLLEGIREYQNNTSKKGRGKGIAGCIYFLKVFVLQNFNPLAVESERPVISVWNKDEMTEAIKKHLKRLENCVASRDAGIEARSWPDDNSLLARVNALEKAVFHKKAQKKASLKERYSVQIFSLFSVVFFFNTLAVFLTT